MVAEAGTSMARQNNKGGSKRPLQYLNCLEVAHSRHPGVAFRQSAFRGTADILREGRNRPFLTLNGHPSAVQRMRARSPYCKIFAMQLKSALRVPLMSIHRVQLAVGSPKTS